MGSKCKAVSEQRATTTWHIPAWAAFFVGASLWSIKMADGDGGGGSYDPCECIFSHEAAMNRLLNLLRNSQTTCTDSECFTDGLPGPPQAAGGDGWGTWMFVLLWFVLAMTLFFTRPSSLRRNQLEKPPPGGSDQDRDNQPPPPGPSVHWSTKVWLSWILVNS